MAEKFILWQWRVRLKPGATKVGQWNLAKEIAMKRLLLAAALIVATGCTMPGQMIEDTEPIAATLAQPPAAAAVCITRNIERREANIITDRRATAGTVELVARVTGNVTTTYAVVHLDPAGTGSAAKIWLAPHMLSGAESVARDLLEGC